MPPPDPLHHALSRALVAASLLALVLFASFPGLDLWVSGLFWSAEGGFRLETAPLAVALRRLIRLSGEGLAVFGLVMAAAGLWRGGAQQTGWRIWAFLGGSIALSAGVIVNLILKNNVGRARPGSIAEFGGAAEFTPAFQVTDQCATNCSFTSGEGALVAAVAFAVGALLWGRLGRPGRRRLLALAGAYLLLGAGMRVAMGRHFLSDTVFSVLVAAAVALLLYRGLGIGQARAQFRAELIAADLMPLRRAALAATRHVNNQVHPIADRILRALRPPK